MFQQTQHAFRKRASKPHIVCVPSQKMYKHCFCFYLQGVYKQLPICWRQISEYSVYPFSLSLWKLVETMCIFRHVASVAFLQDPSIFGMWFLLAVYTHAAYDAPKKVSAEAGEHRFLSSIAMVPVNHPRREQTPVSIHVYRCNNALKN